MIKRLNPNQHIFIQKNFDYSLHQGLLDQGFQ